MKCIICKEPLLGSELRNSKGDFVLSRMSKIQTDVLDNNIKCKPKICKKCFENKFGSLKRGMSKEQYIYAYKPTNDELAEKWSKFGWTYKKSISLYGEKEGKRKWEEYRNRQAYTNSLEYKQTEYGWSEEEYEIYNKKRAVTLKNLVEKHGEKEGKRKWEEYRNRQAYTNSLEYFVEKHGEKEGKKKWEEVNNAKRHSLDTYIFRYGEKEGKKKWEDYCFSKQCFYSSVSQELFWMIYNELPERIQSKTYFGELNHEFGKSYKDTYVKYDFVISSLKICIEFNGDHYHANPKFYEATDIVKHVKGKPFRAQEKWESDFKENKEKVKEMLVNMILKKKEDYEY